MEARLESARRASEVHKKRTGKYLVITEEAVANEEMYEEEGDNAVAALRRLGAFYSGLGSFDKFRDHVGAQVGIRETFMQHQQKMMQQHQASGGSFNSTQQPTMYAHHMPFMPTGQPTSQASARFTGQPNQISTPQLNQNFQTPGPMHPAYYSMKGMMPPNATPFRMGPTSPAVRNTPQPGFEAALNAQRLATSASPSLPPTPGSQSMAQPDKMYPQGYYQPAYEPLRLPKQETEESPSYDSPVAYQSPSVASARCSQQSDSPIRSPAALSQRSQDYRQAPSSHHARQRSQSPQLEGRTDRSHYRQRDYRQRTSTVPDENVPVPSVETSMAAPVPQSTLPKDPLSFALPPELQQMFGTIFDPTDPTTAALMQGSQNYPQLQNGNEGFTAQNDMKATQTFNLTTAGRTPSAQDMKLATKLTPNDTFSSKLNEASEWPFGYDFGLGQDSFFDTNFADLTNDPAAGTFDDSMFDMINFDALDAQI